VALRQKHDTFSHRESIRPEKVFQTQPEAAFRTGGIYIQGAPLIIGKEIASVNCDTSSLIPCNPAAGDSVHLDARRECSPASLQPGKKFPRVNAKLLVDSFWLRFGKKFLKTSIVADRVPDEVDLQTRNGNDLTGRSCNQLAKYFYSVSKKAPLESCSTGG